METSSSGTITIAGARPFPFKEFAKDMQELATAMKQIVEDLPHAYPFLRP